MNKENEKYTAIELFAGAGGLALGLHNAGIECLALNENDKWACETLRNNMSNWNVIEQDIRTLDLEEYSNRVDIITGGFPCQAFSYAGKKLGLEDARGTLFYEFARIIKQVNPKICVGENVKGLLTHDGGKTLEGMLSILNEIGYNVIKPTIFKTINYNVPQKRERILIVAIRKDLDYSLYEFPKKNSRIFTLKDALKAGELFDTDVPKSEGFSYPEKKKRIMRLVPPGGYWKDLPLDIQKEYMGSSFYQSGGKTGIARRISWDEPCLTLTCSPAQKQTDKCHPDETRPFTVREYARIQTFPDNWKISGPLSQQYKQIGNAVPVNFAKEIGISLIKFLDLV